MENVKADGLKDIDNFVNQQINNGKNKKGNTSVNPVIASISHIQEMAAIEGKSDQDIDSKLFTLQKVVQFAKAGLYLSITSNILFVLFFICLLGAEIAKNVYGLELIGYYVLKYVFAIILGFIILYFSLLARYDEGKYTFKAITILFSSKMVFSFLIGYLFFTFVVFTFESDFVKGNDLIDILNFCIDYFAMSETTANQIFKTIKYTDLSQIYIHLVVLLFMNTLFPLIFLLLNKSVFKINAIKEYENY